MKSPSPFVLKDGNVFACDVDDSLVMWQVPDDYEESKYGPLVRFDFNGHTDYLLPNYHAIEHLKKLKLRNYAIVVWSAGGSEWANLVVQTLNLNKYVDLIMPKIKEHLDDVKDPKDKIGRWSYVDLEGNVSREDLVGNIIKIPGVKNDKN